MNHKRKQTCKTTNESGSKKKNAPCQFPFTVGDDKTFDACTTELDPDGRFWCSTKVDNSGKHVSGNYGYCSDDCFSSTTTTTTTTTEKPTCLTTDEPASFVKNAPCIFPWKIGDQTYDSCTTDDDPDGRLWCATKLDASGTLIDRQWGYCPEECRKKEESNDTTSGLWQPTEYDGCGSYLGRNINDSSYLSFILKLSPL